MMGRVVLTNTQYGTHPHSSPFSPRLLYCLSPLTLRTSVTADAPPEVLTRRRLTPPSKQNLRKIFYSGTFCNFYPSFTPSFFLFFYYHIPLSFSLFRLLITFIRPFSSTVALFFSCPLFPLAKQQPYFLPSDSPTKNSQCNLYSHGNSSHFSPSPLSGSHSPQSPLLLQHRYQPIRFLPRRQ